jgi:HlyD family secretion protein
MTRPGELEGRRGITDRPVDGSAAFAARPAAVTGARPRFSPAKRRYVGRVALLLVVVSAVGLGVWLRLRPKPVTTTEAVRGTAIDAVYAIATVEALDRVTIKAKVPGSILELKVREGDVVKKGDLLAVIDNPSLKFQLERGRADQWAASQQASLASPQVGVVEAQARMTEASLKNAAEERGRLEKLVASGAATRSDLDRVTANVSMLEAQLASQRAQAKALRIDLTAKSSGSNAAVAELAAKLADAEVRAPSDGVVLVRLVEPGELVPLNGTLFKIGDVRSLVLECSVDEADIGRLALGKKAAVSLYAFPKQVFHGAVFDILPDADRAKKSFLVKVRIEGAPPQLRSGMSAEVNIIVEEHPNALLAPSEAVDVSSSVWILRGDRVEKRTVEIGVRDMLRVEILAGLVDGDRLVVAGMNDLQPGTRVHATFQAPNMNAVLPKGAARGGGAL